MTDMIERVARAIWGCGFLLESGECMVAARAAIEAMREPSEVACLAGGAVIDASDDASPYTALTAYRAMIDAALVEQQKPGGKADQEARD